MTKEELIKEKNLLESSIATAINIVLENFYKRTQLSPSKIELEIASAKEIYFLEDRFVVVNVETTIP